ncbi:hypothetical protein Tco_0738227 [Tanacetum coccineum]
MEVWRGYDGNGGSEGSVGGVDGGDDATGGSYGYCSRGDDGGIWSMMVWWVSFGGRQLVVVSTTVVESVGGKVTMVEMVDRGRSGPVERVVVVGCGGWPTAAVSQNPVTAPELGRRGDERLGYK